MKTITKLILAVSAGAVAGAAIGILFAPDEGRETINKINKRRRKIAKRLKQGYEEATGKYNDLAEGITKVVKDKVKAVV